MAVNAQDLIPYPQRLEPGQGGFSIGVNTPVRVAPVFQREATLLRGLILRIPATEANAPVIEIDDDPTIDTPEAYRLIITPDKLQLRAHDGAGVVHGIETIRQLLPPAAEQGGMNGTVMIPALTIEDYPRYGWRGMHLDVSRHFFSIGYLHRLIDRMALYKLNKLHLHLTDDQGWRVEIKRYPLLTSEGAWRVFNNQDSICMAKAVDDPDFAIDSSHIIVRNGRKLYGGFYTQRQLRELVAYAAERHIDIIPEIDMPGHMMAAINHYPFLTCNGENKWGELFTKPICPCNESTFEFAEHVYSEIMDIFPSKYIHIGGDEVDRSDWAKSPACRALMEKEEIKDLPGLESYFIGRMEKFFASRGRVLVGWDEIIEGPISKEAIVMYWRTWVKQAPYRAAAAGNRIIMAPGEPLYFNHPADQYDLSNIYHFDPVPHGFDSSNARLVLGAQACLWSEQLPSENRTDYMYMPRMTALAEALWTAQPDLYDSYVRRLNAHFSRMDAMGIHYRIPDISGLLNDYAFTTADTLHIGAPVPTADVHYTTDGRRPTLRSPLLPNPLVVDQDATIRLEAFATTGSHGDVYDLRFRKQPMAPALKDPPSALAPGLSCVYYKAAFKNTGAMAGRQPDSLFTYTGPEVPATVNAPSFGLIYRGYVSVPADGIYSFFLTCDDGGVLRIGDSVVVDNDGNHSAIERSGQAVLEKGFHPFRLDFIEGGGGFTLLLRYSVNGSEPREIPPSWFRH